MLSDIKKLKWKNMKSVEKRFVIGTISIIILTHILILFFYLSNYARILNYPEYFSKYILLEIDKIKIYYPNKFMYLALSKTPNAARWAKYEYLALQVLIFIPYIILCFPIKWIPKDTSHGSARWATFDDLGLSGFLTPRISAKAFELNLLEDSGVVLGEVDGRLIRDNGKTHILLSAPTRTGKGVSVIIPTLVDSWKDSVFVLDIKGENYQMTAGWRQKEFNNTIFKFSPLSIDSCSFNPMKEVRYLTPDEIDDAKTIAQIIVIDEGSSDPFWGLAGSDLATTLILYELYKGKGEANLSNVVKFITDPTGPLELRLKKLINKPIFDPDRDEEILEKLLEIYTAQDDQEQIKRGIHPFIDRGIADALGKGEKTLQSIVATAKSKLSIFESPNVEKNTSISDFRILDLMAADKPISLYIVVPPGQIQPLAPLLRILIIQCVQLLTPEMDYSGNSNKIKFKHRLLMLLDEFPAIGKMEILEKAIGFVAGYGMKMMLVVQSLDQLNKIYSENNMFMGNCQTQVFYTANDNKTAEYISKTIGQETVISKSVSSDGGGFFSKKNVSVSKSGRDLIRPDEMRRFPLDKILLLVGGKPPIKSNKVLFFKDKRFKDKVKLPINPTPAMQREIELQKGSEK
ncbi:type IV secretory system conjugative DNA transfer family protein [Streptobacillus moniliformis]|uniref:TRAG family protein n=2 Tax=Streptobacillus moniliformis TaxID=34105 RepID=D1AV80_STRM9|nr:type IV secretory system conjugative DNA transfer family protein [Streptobacillus moniliformis]ACZ01640.1 TRAG family protein [Streptobacillus moniliformis DSM 12112]AVL43360.1 conjugal transfer protein TraG [Streptobacillus moniliformis]SQA13181.1 Conjugal transfer protein traG [Streptobacillus moniliformis]